MSWVGLWEDFCLRALPNVQVQWLRPDDWLIYRPWENQISCSISTYCRFCYAAYWDLWRIWFMILKFFFSLDESGAERFSLSLITVATFFFIFKYAICNTNRYCWYRIYVKVFVNIKLPSSVSDFFIMKWSENATCLGLNWPSSWTVCKNRINLLCNRPWRPIGLHIF
jgi:hypothetical protein